MTPLFINDFKVRNPCQQCDNKAQKYRKFCAYHLRIAREKFRTWCDERRGAGRCIHCERAGFKAGDKRELRCAKHKAINQTRCKSWADRIRKLTRNTGICHQCPKNLPVIAGTLRCEACFKKEQKYRELRKEKANGRA
jgi:hypothetical protein